MSTKNTASPELVDRITEANFKFDSGSNNGKPNAPKKIQGAQPPKASGIVMNNCVININIPPNEQGKS